MTDRNENRVRVERKKQGKTIVTLCKETGLSITTLALADQGVLSPRTAELLGKALGVRPGDLLPKHKK